MLQVFCRKTEAMDAQFQMRKSKALVTCLPAPGLTGENGACVWVSFVMALAPTQGLGTVFLQ